MIYLGSDHRGYELKEFFKGYLKDAQIAFQDMGPSTYVSDDDYPVYSEKVARALENESDKGVLICGGGHGVCVTANKIKGVRASLMDSTNSAKVGRNDDNINVLCLGEDFVTKDQALDILKTFLETPFSGANRHVRRIEQIKKLES